MTWFTVPGKLGKRPARSDPRTLRLAKYTTKVPTPPPDCNWGGTITDWGVMGNDELGDCTIAAVGHAIQGWSQATGTLITVPDTTVKGYYSDWAGYVEGHPETDRGAYEVDILNKWRKFGFGKSAELNHILFAYADPDPRNTLHIKQAIWLFGGVYIGLALPITASRQFNLGNYWDMVDGAGADGVPGSWGGHAVWVPKYTTDAQGNLILWCVTWGRLQAMTERFWYECCDESHALLASTWNIKDLYTFGFYHDELMEDLYAVVS